MPECDNNRKEGWVRLLRFLHNISPVLRYGQFSGMDILHQIYRIIKGNEIDFIPFLFPIPIDIIAYCEAIVRTIVLSYSFDIVKATFLYAF